MVVNSKLVFIQYLQTFLFGKDVAALPDGRLATEPLADGVSPRQGNDVNGPTAASNSVAKLDHAQARMVHYIIKNSLLQQLVVNKV